MKMTVSDFARKQNAEFTFLGFILTRLEVQLKKRKEKKVLLETFLENIHWFNFIWEHNNQRFNAFISTQEFLTEL